MSECFGVSWAESTSATSHLPVSLLLPLQCDDMVRGLSPQKAMLRELQRPQQEAATAFLELVECPVPGSGAGTKDVDSAPKLLSMAYLLLSALAGMDGKGKARCPFCFHVPAHMLQISGDPRVVTVEDLHGVLPLAALNMEVAFRVPISFPKESCLSPHSLCPMAALLFLPLFSSSNSFLL